MKKKNVITKNYLEKIPTCSPEIKWSKDEKGIVTLEIENKGWANRIAQVVRLIRVARPDRLWP